MKTLLFLSRVAFLCNICMVLALIMRYISFVDDINVQATIIIAGFLMAVIFNLITLVWVSVLMLKSTQGMKLKMPWLFVFNFLCLIFQLYFLQK